jgi:hypothetical protein
MNSAISQAQSIYVNFLFFDHLRILDFLPPRPHCGPAPNETFITLFGAGVASFAAAAFLIRDGKMRVMQSTSSFFPVNHC